MLGENDHRIEVPRFEEDNGFYATPKSSHTMKRIRSIDTKAEVIFRKTLWSKGFRYRLHSKTLMGKPDLIFVRSKVVVFIDGDFWHGFNWDIKKERMTSNKAYWIPKIERNMQRDLEVTANLEADGWHVVRFWEHEVFKNLNDCIEKLISILRKYKN